MKRSLRSRSQTRRQATRLGVQKLERRELMAADIGLADGFVSINGTEQNDVAEVYSESGSVIVKLTSYDASGQELSATSETYDQADVNGIVFQAGEGDDLFVNETSIDSITRSGGGNDTVLGGSGNDILAMGSGNDIALGGGGDDIILGGPGENVNIPEPDEALDQNEDTTNVETGENPADDSIVDSQSSDDAEIADLEPSLEVEITIENEFVAEMEDVEDTMLEADTDTIVIDSDTVESELLELDVPSEEGLESDTSSGEVDAAANEADSDLDVVHNCSSDLDDSGSDASPTVTVQAQPDADVNDSLAVADAHPLPAADMDFDEQGAEAEQSPTVMLDELEPLTSDELDGDAANDGSPQVLPETVDGEVDNDDQSEPVDEVETFDTEAPLVAADDSSDATDNDVIFGGSGDDWIFGEDGEDLIFGGSSIVDDALLRMMITGRL